jgi:hypothetical protein
LAFSLARRRRSAALRAVPLPCFSPRSSGIRISRREDHLDGGKPNRLERVQARSRY